MSADRALNPGGLLPTLGAMAHPTLDDDLRRLADLLWRSRDQLEQVEFLLDVQHLLVAGGREVWLPRLVEQLEVAARDVAAVDAQWTDLQARLGPALGIAGRVSLRDLADRAPSPWAEVLTDHLTWFAGQAPRLAETGERARAAAIDGLGAVRELLQELRGASGAGYDHGGRPITHAGAGSLLFDDRA